VWLCLYPLLIYNGYLAVLICFVVSARPKVRDAILPTPKGAGLLARKLVHILTFIVIAYFADRNRRV
jgi:hypothetical protein